MITGTGFLKLEYDIFPQIIILEDVFGDKWQYLPVDSIPQPQLNVKRLLPLRLR